MLQSSKLPDTQGRLSNLSSSSAKSSPSTSSSSSTTPSQSSRSLLTFSSSPPPSTNWSQSQSPSSSTQLTWGRMMSHNESWPSKSSSSKMINCQRMLNKRDHNHHQQQQQHHHPLKTLTLIQSLTNNLTEKRLQCYNWKSLGLLLVIFQLFNCIPLLTGLGARCPSMCECIWRGGKPTAECAGQNLMNIPTGISNFIQVLNLSRNNFQTLPPKVFQERGLINLQKVYLSECKLGRVAPDAFIQLTNLVDLDLSSNLLTSIPSESLRYTSSLRRLNLHGNPIQAVKEDSFANLPHLVHLDLSDCQIDTIEPGALRNLKGLEQLKLDGNRLSTLPAGTFVGLPLLNIGLHRNPWKCDCELRPTLEWLNKARLTPNVPPSCSTPSKLNGLMWNSLELSAYACPPVFKVQETELKASLGSNLSLVCAVKSTPQAKIYWSFEEIGDTSNTTSSYIGGPAVAESGNNKYSVVEDLSIGPDTVSSTLIIHNLDYPDARRHYICTAENQADSTSKNFTIILTSSQWQASFSGWSKVEIAGSVITFLLVFILTLVLVAVCMMRNKKDSCVQGNDKCSAVGDVLKNSKYGGGGGDKGSNKVISEPRLKQGKDTTGSSSGYGSNGVTPDLTSNVIKSMDYTPMCPPIDYYPGLLQVSNPLCKADSCEIITDHHNTMMANEQSPPIFNNYENYDAYAAHTYQQQLINQQQQLQALPDNVGYTNFTGSYVGLNQDVGLSGYAMDKRNQSQSFTNAAPVQQPIHEANLVNLHHVNVVGQGSYNISHPTIVRYSPDEGYAEEQANPPYILEGTEV